MNITVSYKCVNRIIFFIDLIQFKAVVMSVNLNVIQFNISLILLMCIDDLLK